MAQAPHFWGKGLNRGGSCHSLAGCVNAWGLHAYLLQLILDVDREHLFVGIFSNFFHHLFMIIIGYTLQEWKLHVDIF